MFRYTKAQIWLHWAVVGLIVVQFVGHEAMVEAWDAWRRTGTVGPSVGVAIHVIFGVTVLVLALLRLVLRRRAPSPPPATSLAERVGGIVHGLLIC